MKTIREASGASIAKVAAHAAAGGTLNTLQGGKFGHGFLSAGVTEALSPAIGAASSGGGAGGVVAGTVASAVVGGTVSELSGGKFGNGAMTGAFSYAFGRMASGGGAASEWTGADADSAARSDASYYGKDGGLLGEFGIPYSSSGGFSAWLSLGDDGQYVLAFAGTSPGSWANWRANFRQAFGLGSTQYDQAISLAGKVRDATGGNVHFVGHSLGGGLAAAAAYATGGSATTFNAAGLHSMYRNGTPGAIRAHYIRGEILTTLQQWTPLPNAVSLQIPHLAGWSQGPIQRHFMSSFP